MRVGRHEGRSYRSVRPGRFLLAFPARGEQGGRQARPGDILSQEQDDPSQQCELNTHRTTSECVARGNALYAFYTAYFSDTRFAPVLSRLCDDVTPLCNFSSTADSSCVKQSEVKCGCSEER